MFNLKKVVQGIAVLGSALLLMGASPGDEHQVPSPDSFPSRVVWTSDGKHIIFSRGFQGIFKVDVAGSELQAIPDGAPIGTPSSPGYALPARSPDGTRLAYVARLEGQSAAIMVSALDGTGARRLTHDEKFNTHPAWSPDGEEISYIADGKLSILRADGTNARELTPSVEAVNAAPEWSPDGSRIAFVGELQDPVHRAVYTVRPDGTELTLLGPTVSVPSWSPDSSRIAFLMPEEGGEVSLFTLDNSGVDPQKVWSLGESDSWADTLAWSPVGGAILFASADGEVVVVSLEEVEEKILARAIGGHAAWSPDSARIAIVASRNSDEEAGDSHRDVLFTKMRSGRLRRTLVEGNDERLAAKYPGWYDVSLSIAACGQGYVVSDPSAEGFIVTNPFENAGLVDDCEILMAIRDELAGDFLLNWSTETPITEWWGVVMGPSSPSQPPRVEILWFGHPNLLRTRAESVLPNWLRVVFHLAYEALYYPTPQWRSIDYEHLNGSIPGELANLTSLWILYLGGNELSGSIPAGLANSTSLHWLHLSDNKLTGSIPSELGRSRLAFLDLSNNQLTGSIPPELGNITESVSVRFDGSDRSNGLFFLNLANNDLSGSIPPELGNLSSLQYLILSDNKLEGSIPAELGKLSELKWLYLANNNLSGSIPPELGNLSKVREVHLQGNDLTGCVAARFSSEFVTLITDELEFCAE